MKLRYFYLFLLFFVGFSNASLVFAQTKQNSFVEIRNDFQELEFSGCLDSLQFLPIENEYGNFFKILFPNIEHTENKGIGKPSLPIILKNIEIPFESTPSVEIKIQDSVIYSLQNLKIKGLFFPAQASHFKNPRAEKFVVDEKIYSANKFYGLPLVEVQKLGILRGTQLGRLTFSPVLYNPVTQEIKVYTKFTARIVFANANEETTMQEKAKTFSVFETENPLKVLNPQNAKNLIREKEVVNYPIKYVVLAPDSFQNTLKDFIEWKREKGFEVIEVYTGIQVENTDTEIKKYLSDLYHNSTATNPAPSYLAIIGDTPQIPTFFVKSGTHHPELGGHCTDLFYAEYTGDIYPDLFYGRIPARNKSQLEAMLKKTVEYEKYEFHQGDDFLKNILLVAGEESTEPAFTLTNGQLNYLQENYFENAVNTTASVFYNQESRNRTSEIETKLNTGNSLVNYTSHCTTGGWSKTTINTTKASAFTNTNKYFFSINNCCWSSQFSEPECFGEALLRNPTGGAIGVIGASNETLWQEDYWWSVGAYNLPETPAYQANSLGVFDRFLHTHGESNSEWRASLGEILQAGGLAITQVGSNLEAFYWEIYNVLGDPSLMPYLGIPENLSIQISDSLPIGTKNIEITGTPWTYVALSANKELLGTCLLDKNGKGSLPILKTVSSGSLKLVATKQFAKPFFKTIPLFAPNEACLALWNYSIKDSTGSETKSIKAGESLTLTLQLKNVGKTTSYQSKVKMLSESGNLSFDQIEYVFDSVRSNEVLTRDFTITANTHIENLSIEKLQISINGRTEKEIPLLVLSPQIKIAKVESVNRCETSNIYDLTMVLENVGRADLNNATIELIPFAMGQNESSSKTFSLKELQPRGKDTLYLNIDCLLFVGEESLNIRTNIQNPAGFQQMDTISIFLRRTMEDFETADFSKYAWTQKGSGWAIESNVRKVFAGSYSAHSNNKQDLTTSTLSIKINVMQADTLSFFYKVSSEVDFDELIFSINKEVKNRWSGEIDWRKCIHLLPVGEYLLEWKYVKDESGFSGEDAAWIDNIVFPPYGKNFSEIVCPQENNDECLVYPNPANNDLNICLNASDEKVISMNVFNAMGKKMLASYKQTGNNNCCILDVQSYPQGIYFVILQTRNKIFQKRFMVIR